jgi:hypothetical protein
MKPRFVRWQTLGKQSKLRLQCFYTLFSTVVRVAISLLGGDSQIDVAQNEKKGENPD